MQAAKRTNTIIGRRGIPPKGDFDAALDETLAALVLRAQTGDRVARDEIYDLLHPSLERWVWRYWRIVQATDALVEQDDVAHEGYLILVDLIEKWPGEASFGAYVLSRFPWRLRDAAWRLAGRSTWRRRRADPSNPDGQWHLLIGGQVVPPGAGPPRQERPPQQLADTAARADEALVQLEALAGALGEPDGCILLWRIRDCQNMTVIADRLGLTRRTVHRRWEHLLDDLRQMLI